VKAHSLTRFHANGKTPTLSSSSSSSLYGCRYCCFCWNDGAKSGFGCPVLSKSGLCEPARSYMEMAPTCNPVHFHRLSLSPFTLPCFNPVFSYLPPALLSPSLLVAILVVAISSLVIFFFNYYIFFSSQSIC